MYIAFVELRPFTKSRCPVKLETSVTSFAQQSGSTVYNGNSVMHERREYVGSDKCDKYAPLLEFSMRGDVLARNHSRRPEVARASLILPTLRRGPCWASGGRHFASPT